jgi:hypothetical protein
MAFDFSEVDNREILVMLKYIPIENFPKLSKTVTASFRPPTGRTAA